MVVEMVFQCALYAVEFLNSRFMQFVLEAIKSVVGLDMFFFYDNFTHSHTSCLTRVCY